MGKTTGFQEFERRLPPRRPVKARLADHLELYEEWPTKNVEQQAARCMDCGIPFCHSGCPLGNLIPEFNDFAYHGRWNEALGRLLATNNFPEFTGRVCPAPCEVSCTLAINADPITIELIEKTIVESGFSEGLIRPEPPQQRTGKSVAVVGSGPAGMAVAQQLNRAGHRVTVYERDEVIGGLLRLGIPDFKLAEWIVQRRVDLMAEEGIEFVTNSHVGVNVAIADLRKTFDAFVLAGGSTVPRDLDVPGRELDGIHFAMEYLPQQNRINAGRPLGEEPITAEGKRVVILGGGDTGADCLGTAHRQGAASVQQFELLPEPPEQRAENNPWPQWSRVLRLSAAHEEGGEIDYKIATSGFSGSGGRVEKLHASRVSWQNDNGRFAMEPVANGEFEVEAELVLLALGFLHPEHDTMLNDFGVDLTEQGNVATNDDKMTSVDGVFSAGDMRRGQSLVVWAIAEGRAAAHGVDKMLMGQTTLPWVSV